MCVFLFCPGYSGWCVCVCARGVFFLLDFHELSIEKCIQIYQWVSECECVLFAASNRAWECKFDFRQKQWRSHLVHCHYISYCDFTFLTQNFCRCRLPTHTHIHFQLKIHIILFSLWLSFSIWQTWHVVYIFRFKKKKIELTHTCTCKISVCK